MSSPLADLSAAGVSIWLDDISRERLRSGNLTDLVANKHVVGVTSNPTIFQKALEKGSAYDEQVADLKVREIAEDGVIRYLMAYDIRWACDVLTDVFESSGHVDGRVSIEVDPRLAGETRRRRCAARRASRTRGWRTSGTRRSSPPTDGRHSPRRAPTCSGRCGRPPA